jgi:predicted RNA-binding Zn-ribbon protein involved in translation (DUF1610 family)
MFEDIINKKTVTIDNVSMFYCGKCNMSITETRKLTSIDCPICGRILLENSSISFPLINKHNDYFGTTASC